MKSPMSSARAGLRARCAKAALLLAAFNLIVPSAFASMVTGAPTASKAIASSPARSGSAARTHVQDYGGKEAAVDEMRSLQAQMADLRQQLAANPQNATLRDELKTIQDEFNAISASMGGDVPGPVGYEPAPASPEKDAVYAQMRDLQATMTNLRSRISAQPENARFQRQYDAASLEYRQLSDSMGGDEPGPLASTSLERPEVVAMSPTGCLATTTTFTNTTPVPIPSSGTPTVTSTITVSGKDIYTWDIDATTFITHTFCSDLDVTLTSPAGTVVTLTTDNAGGNDNCFNGTIWDDQANPGNQVPYANNPGLAADRVYANLVVAPTLVPEEAMGAFKGENPNGVWTLTVSDDTGADGGSIDQWSLGITTFPVGPAETTASFTNSTPVPISTGAASTVTSTLAVAGAGTAITNLVLTTNITHTFSSDLQVTLMSPGGKIVTLTSNNGGSNDNNFAGTVWDDDSNPGNPVPYANNPGLATDRLYANLVLATPLVAEESLSGFFGDDPTGTWTITIADQFTGDGGALNSWTLAVTTGSCLGPCTGTLQTFNNTTPVPISTGLPAVVTSTITVAGAGNALLDANVTTFITHTFVADLDVTLTSPAGTVVTLTTDNGSSNDNCFNGTVWDDQANLGTQVPYANNPGLASDRVYANLVVATPLVPEEAMGAFKGENPNGVWTLTVSDDLNGDGGAINSWSLGLRTNPVAPTIVQNAVTFTNSTPVAIPTTIATVSSTQSVAGLTAPISNVRLTTAITHTFVSDMQITLMSPAGTIVTLTSNNGGGNDNCFNGTLWDDKANPANPVPYANNPGLATDRVYANLVVATPLVPEEAMGAFDGEAGNGTWTVTIADQFTGDGGSLASWTLEITTSACGQTPCVLTCPANITMANTAGQCGATVNYAAPTTSGTCSTVTCVPASGSFFAIGTTTVNCTAGAAACSFTVTVNDTEVPTITCPANITQSNDANQCGAVVAYAAPTVGDNCPGLVPNCSPASGSFFPVGSTTVTCTVSDASANMATCMFTVTVNDTQAPTITCPANITQANDANQCGAVVSFTPTASDNCPGVTVACTPASGSFFPVGVTPVNCTATDASANTATCSFSVTVQDTQAPAITCPANIITPATTTMGTTLGAIVNYPAPVASDNCPGVTASCVPASGSFFPVGTNTVTCTATDASPNSPDSMCTFTITVGTAFTHCYLGDGTGDTFSIVADPASPLYRLWQYRVAATGQIFTGMAEGLSLKPNISLIAYDRDSPLYVMNANVSIGGRTATITVKIRATNVTHTLRDQLITDDPPCQ